MCVTRRSAVLVIFLLLVAGPAVAGPDDVKVYRKEIARVRFRQKAYESKAIAEDLRAADEVFRAPWRERGGPDAPTVIDYDFSGFANVYERHAEFARDMGRLALSLTRANDEAAAEALLGTLLDVLDESLRHDREVGDTRAVSRGVADQAPGIRRYTSSLHRDLVVDALRLLTSPDATGWLGTEGFAEAADFDRKRKTDRARIALLDAATAANTALLSTQAGAKEPRIRIAALEALARTSPGPDLVPRLKTAQGEDPCRVVRAAASALLGEPAEAAPPDSPRFFGIPIAGRRVLLLLETGSYAVKPADVELMKERSYMEWRAVAEKDRHYATQLSLTCDQASAFIGALPADASFDVLDLGDGDRIAALSPRGLLPADRANVRRADQFLAERVAGGFVSPIEGLWEASRRAGIDPFGSDLPDDPEADAILFVGAGVPRGGPVMYVAAILDDLRRRHRFLRIPVHTVRLDDCAAPAEELLEGIAEITGGTYAHITAP